MKLFNLVGLLLITSLGFSQQYSFDELVNFELLDAGPITSKNEVQGYYLFFEKDKTEVDSSEFIIKILDQNLNELTNKTVMSSPNTKIESLVFNGQSILLKQFEKEGKSINFIIQNMKVNGELEPFGNRSLKTGKHSKSILYAVPNLGFVNIYVDDKRQSIIEFYNKDGLQWTYTTPEEIKWEEIDYLTSYEHRLIFNSYRANVVTQGGDYFLKALNVETGEVEFDEVMTQYGYDHEITRGFTNPLQEEIWLTGDYFDKGEEEKTENSNGLFIMKVSPTGDILDSDYAPWDGKINRYAKSYKKGKLKEGFLYMHDFVFLESGEVFGIAEQYRKSFRAWGLAEAALTVGTYGRLAKVDIGDIMAFKFGTNAKLVETKRNRKPEKRVIPNKGFYGGLFIPGKKIGDVVADLHAYDFAHVSVDNNNESFTLFYYTKENLSKKQQKQYKRGNRYILRTLTYKDREWSKDKFYLTDGKGESEIYVLPAKPGYVLISEHSKETRGLRLEKIK